MRLWTLHPRYLDSRGLVALWREALLAQRVLQGRTKGYRHHPQLQRFLAEPRPEEAIAAFLLHVSTEADARGYSFNRSLIGAPPAERPVEASEGQILFEWEHLRRKLAARDPAWLGRWDHVIAPDPHPMFVTVPGGIAPWEKSASE
jgi:hypothetical protein